MKLSLNSLCCEIRKLIARVVLIESDVTDIQDSYNVETTHGVAAPYSLTNTAAAVNPSITLGEAGRYLLHATVKLDYAGATVVAETATLTLRRTNNTPADIANTSVVIDLPVATTLTHTYGVVTFPPVEYVTANDDDAITIFGSLSAALGAGNINVTMADILAVRIL